MTQSTLHDFAYDANETSKNEGKDNGIINCSPRTKKAQKRFKFSLRSNTTASDSEYMRAYWNTTTIEPRKLLKLYYKTEKKGSEITDLILNGYHYDRRRRKEKNIDELEYDDFRDNWYLLYQLALIHKDEILGINHNFKPDRKDSK